MRGKYPNDPEFEEMDPFLKMFMYAQWIQDQNDKVEILKNHGYLIASFIDPQSVKKILGQDGTQYATTDEEFDESLRMVKESHAVNKKKSKKKKILNK